MSSSAIAKGFTLIELLVVISLLVMVMSLLPPLFRPVMEHHSLYSESQRLVLLMRQARNEAMLSQKTQRIDLDASKQRIAYNNRHVELAASTKLDAKVSRQSDNSQQGSIVFYADGSSSGGRLLLADNHYAFAIDVNWVTGQIQLSKQLPM
ncbi:GspH/FimT family pseudopilin [Methylophaga sp.]|uniref:GspH/FimT family pseudopilin n=1 Tax=Methylophaga sp. TaxID=2024840 RepID=UPI003A8F2E76